MGFLGFHHLGSFLLLVSTALLTVSIVTAPISRIALLKVSSASRGDLLVGVLGYCRVIENADDACSSAKLGFELTTALQFAFGQNIINESLNKLTYGLVLHIVSAGLTLVAFVIAALSQRFGYIAAAILAGLAWIFSVITIAVDLALFLPARSKLTDSGATVSWGVGFWCTVAAIVLLFFGAIATLFSTCTERKKKRLGATGQEYAYVRDPPVMGYNYGQPYGQSAMVPLSQQSSYTKY